MKNGDVICEEHGTKLGDPDLVACCKDFNDNDPICADLPKWDDQSEEDQMWAQLAWVAPMPDFSPRAA